MRVLKRKEAHHGTPPVLNNKTAQFKTTTMYPVTQGSSQNEVQKFNKEHGQYIQSFRTSLNQGNNAFTPVLASSGTFFKGIALTASAFTSLADTQVTFLINNRSLLVDTSALLLIPNYTQGILYYPLPQPLDGKDTFKINFLKNDAGTVVSYFTFVYIPKM